MKATGLVKTGSMTAHEREEVSRDDVVSADTAVDLDPRTRVRTGYAPTVTPDSIAPVESEPAPHDDGAFALRYLASDLLGEGGMGEVRLARDARIGRDVAMKVVRAGQGSRSDMRSRFLREARVQGQLEHPAIVPVYDLGARPDGAAFFTMKRVRGETLEKIIDDLREGSERASADFSRRKLLSAFNSVCLAIDFAHARGVVHRDLKPGNIMLGGFGEVYVLDWGLAKIKTDEAPLSGAEKETVDAPQSTRGQTEAGSVMGTPGYMAPEQLVTTEVDRRADVYALGAILFEICTLKPLHDKPKVAQVISSTLTGADMRASIVAPDREIPPELEAIWSKALALKKEDRYESARELSDDLERFLDGDRDLEQRKKMAQNHVQRGEEAARRARKNQSASERKMAMQELGRALALDPSNGKAMRAMAELLSEPPAELPAEAQEELARTSARSLRVSGRVGFYAYAVWFVFLPITILMGTRDVWLSASMGVCMFGACLSSWLLSRQERPTLTMRLLAVGFSMTAIAISARIFGPFMLVPAMALANTIGFALTRGRPERIFVAILGVAVFAVPLVLEWTGVISPSYVFENGAITMLPHIFSFDHPFWTNVLLVSSHASVIVAAVVYVGVVRDHLARYERHALLQAWHFRQLAPDEARAAAPVDPPPAAHCPIDGAHAGVVEKRASSG